MVDVADSKSAGGDTVWVRAPPPVPDKQCPSWGYCLFFCFYGINPRGGLRLYMQTVQLLKIAIEKASYSYARCFNLLSGLVLQVRSLALKLLAVNLRYFYDFRNIFKRNIHTLDFKIHFQLIIVVKFCFHITLALACIAVFASNPNVFSIKFCCLFRSHSCLSLLPYLHTQVLYTIQLLRGGA